MLEYIKKVSGQISEFFKGLSSEKKTALVLLSIVVMVGLVFLFVWAGTTTYRPLMTNLGAEDSSNVIRILRSKKIPFKVGDDGKDIRIPPEYVYDLRLELAAMGLPESSNVGYEIFDKQSVGTTNFVQKVNQKRALEGELMRTINTIKGVKRSRVHLVLPKKSAFIEDQKPPTASVVLDLDYGITLSEKQVYGVGNLVSSAVEGLDVSQVVILNSHGKTLSKNNRDPLVALTADQLDFQRKIEDEFEDRIEALLSPVVGDGSVVARVTAELDFSQVQETQTTYDGDSAAIRSNQKVDDSAKSDRPGPYGLPGATSNSPEGTAIANQNNLVKTDTRNYNETTNYEIPQTVRKIVSPTGTIKKLSVAVIINDQEIEEKGEDGKVTSRVVPWPPEKLKEFEEVVRSAVAINSKRGDSIEIRSMPFEKENFEEADRLIEETLWRTYVQNVVIYSVIGIIIIMFFLFVVRPFIKWVTENTIDSVDSFLPQTIEELEKMQQSANIKALEEAVPDLPEQIDPEKVEGEMIKEKIVTLVDANPHKAAFILRDWLREEPEKNAKEGGKGKTA